MLRIGRRIALMGVVAALLLQPALADLRHRFGRLGVPVLAAPEGSTVPQVLERLQRLRAAVRR